MAEATPMDGSRVGVAPEAFPLYPGGFVRSKKTGEVYRLEESTAFDPFLPDGDSLWNLRGRTKTVRDVWGSKIREGYELYLPTANEEGLERLESAVSCLSPAYGRHSLRLVEIRETIRYEIRRVIGFDSEEGAVTERVATLTVEDGEALAQQVADMPEWEVE